MIRIHYLQHVPFEDLGYMAKWAAGRGHEVTSTRLDLGEAPPSVESLDWLIVMGGPMNVYEEDRYPWLADEKRFIREAIEGGRRVLGICLGAQLIASVLGARVYANPAKEIGWFPVRLTEEGQGSPFFASQPPVFDAFHWHGDTFDIPTGALHLVRSDGCPHQAFSVSDRVLALQFHLEAVPEGVRKLIVQCGGEIVFGPYIQSAGEMLADERRFRAIHRLMETILGCFESGMTGK